MAARLVLAALATTRQQPPAAAWRHNAASRLRAFSAEPAAAAPSSSSDATPSSSGSAHNVPAGHHASDLSPQVCHIGLRRRHDMCLRQDLKLWQTGDCTKPPLSVAEVFKGYKALLVGFPGGKVCTERHLPGYRAAAEELKKAGVKKVVCVTVADPTVVAAWAANNGFGPGTGCPGMELQVLADKTGGFVRMLGVEAPADARAGGHPPCFRYAAVVDDGVILRIAVEKACADVDVTGVASMLRTFREAYA